MSDLAQAIRRAGLADVDDSALARALYSSDASLYRVPPQEFTDRAAWQGWSAAPDGGWGEPPTALWADRVGEMSIRQIDGKAVLSYFNASTGNMEMRVADDIHPILAYAAV